MKIGIIVHSKTGNTLKVAGMVSEKLTAKGHQVKIEQIKPIGSDSERNAEKIKLEKIPDINSYDAVIFGSPVWGFTATPVIKACFKQISSLKDKKTACFVTQLFPYPWLGGSSTIKQMVNHCESKGAKVSGTGIVNWAGFRREKTIAETVNKLESLF